MKPKWKWISYLTLALVCVVSVLLIWGVGIEPRLVDFRVEKVVIPNLPPAWENRRVALIADLQIGMWLGNEGTVKEIVNRVIEERPAVVLMAGDFVYHPTDDDDPKDLEREDTRDFMREVGNAVALIRPMTEAGIPVYAVLGNHDYGMAYQDSVKNERLGAAVRSSLEAAGVSVIENSAVTLDLKGATDGQNDSAKDAGSTLYLVGVGSRYANNDKPELAVSRVPNGAPRIVFMHNPDSFAAFPANTAQLAVAGHTHGGQIRIPFTKDWSWMALATDEKIQADGWIENFGQPGNRLYVNRGIGFSSFPIRINCLPELTVFSLHGGAR